MAGKKSGRAGTEPTHYETVLVATLSKTRRGKHHDLMAKILDDLKVLAPGSAIKIPLKGLNDVSVAKLRAAVNRATTTKGVSVSTSSDAENFYLWRQNR